MHGSSLRLLGVYWTGLDVQMGPERKTEVSGTLLDGGASGHSLGGGLEFGYLCMYIPGGGWVEVLEF